MRRNNMNRQVKKKSKVQNVGEIRRLREPGVGGSMKMSSVLSGTSPARAVVVVWATWVITLANM